MKCPLCAYEVTWENCNQVDHGEFFEMPVEAKQHRSYDSPYRKEVYGCPRCGVMFMEGDRR